jgi:hypothetical protein
MMLWKCAFSHQVIQNGRVKHGPRAKPGFTTRTFRFIRSSSISFTLVFFVLSFRSSIVHSQDQAALSLCRLFTRDYGFTSDVSAV